MSLFKEVEHQPSIYIGNLRVDEPITMLTDLFVSAVAFYAYWELGNSRYQQQAHYYFRWYFLLLGLATALGGIIGHGFLYLFPQKWKLLGWSIGIVSVMFVERAAISHAKPYLKSNWSYFLMLFNVLETIALLLITWVTFEFKWVEYHNAYALLVNVIGFHGYVYWKVKDKGSFLMLCSVAICGIAAIVFSNQLSLDKWFNHIDLSHIFLALAAFVMYRGATKLGTY